MSEQKVYRLERIADLLAVPRSRRIAATAAVLKTLEAAEDFHELVGALGRHAGLNLGPQPDLGPMEWADDGVDEVSIRVTSEISR